MILYNKRTTKGADQTAHMRRLVCAFVVRKPPKTGFLTTRPNYNNAIRKTFNIEKITDVQQTKTA